jgi:type IV fimbrial biogenesis protein FimT
MKQSGATLVELLSALSVMAILLVMGVPSFTALARNSHLTSIANEVFASLYLARSEAIKRNGRAVLCPSRSGNSCAESGGWGQGWIVFADANNNKVVDQGEPIVLTRQSLGQGYNLNGNTNIAKYISYTPSGATKLASGAFQAGTFTLCHEADPGNSRKIIISMTGRPRIEHAELSSCP